MNENPFLAPAEDRAATDRKPISLKRRIALFWIVPCLLIVAFCLIPIGCAILEIVTVRNMDLNSAESVLTAIYFMNATTWSATAWAIWKNRSRAIIAALFADILALALGLLA